MKHILLGFATCVGVIVSMAACTQATVKETYDRTQLFCGLSTASGPLIVALVSVTETGLAGVAVTTKQAVDAACALAGGIPVSPPPATTVTPRVAIPGFAETVKN